MNVSARTRLSGTMERNIRYLRRIVENWHKSVVFKLGTATSGIVVLVTLLQASVGLHIFRMNDAQISITQTSMPLFDKTQRFARLTTGIVSQTALLGAELTEAELIELRAKYDGNEALAEGILRSILENLSDENLTTTVLESRNEFERVNEQLFDNQFAQRSQERAINAARSNLLTDLAQLKDWLDRSLIETTIQMLKPSPSQPSRAFEEAQRAYRRYAGEIEVLNSLRSSAIDMSNMLTNINYGQNIDQFEKNIGFELRGFAQSLTLLAASNAPRRDMARVSSLINRQLSDPGGLIDLMKSNHETRLAFEALKRKQIVAIEDIDRHADQIVLRTGDLFQNDIGLATEISQNILWIGIATIALVLGGIYILNHRVIRQQISERFITLTQDVLAISEGNYAHKIRVAGEDEIGDIAKALNGFKAQAAELKRSNAELERFAYVAAHDLRSPLDAIQDLARWTLEDERENLSPSCIHNLELLIRRSARLSELQSDLLTYAKIADMNTSAQIIDLQGEVSKLSDLLDPEGNFEIKLEGDPGRITTHGVPLRQILMNLITNAIKHHDAGAGHITVHYERVGAAHRFTVEDDGPGIEERFQAKIFELFKVLKSRDKVEGSGLGLALVSKLVERLQGRLWVESDAPEIRGSKFIFELADLADKRHGARLAA